MFRTLVSIPSLKAILVEGTGISESAPGFIGVLDGPVWYVNETRAKEAEENAKGEAYPGDTKDAPK